jgi:hypothetical protein
MVTRPAAPGHLLKLLARGAVAGMAVIVLCSYARLLPAGHWQGDEFGMLHAIQRVGIRYPFDRMVGAEVTGRSPRPLSEILDWAYMRTAMVVGRPLIPEILGLLWFMAVVLAVAIPALRRDGRGVATGLTLLALALMLREPGEAFYWPVGACAYVPMIGAVIGATVLLRGPLRSSSDLWRLAALQIVAACSNEIGATVALAWSGLATALTWRRPVARLPLIGPGIVGAVICGLTWFGRMQDASEVWAHTPYANATGASLLGALPILGRIFLNGPALVSGLAPNMWIGSAMLLAGVVLFARGSDNPAPNRRLALAWGGAMILGAWLSIAAALRAFGTYCCQRHTTVQETLVLLSVATLAGLLPLALSRTRAVLLACGMAFLLNVRAEALRQSAAAIPAIEQVRAQNWAALKSPGSTVRFIASHGTPVANGNGLHEGIFHRGDPSTPWDAQAILDGFGKDMVTVVVP